MLVLSRRVGETIVINDDIRVTVVAVQGAQVRLGVVAPRSVQVDRMEVHERCRALQAVDPPVAVPVATGGGTRE
jgi:carbon storage regulator